MATSPSPVWIPQEPCTVEEVIERNPTIRQSLLSGFDNCNLFSLFDMQSRWGWGSPESAAGTIFHRFAAEALETMRRTKNGKIPVAEALEILYEVAEQRDVPPWDRAIVPMRLQPRLRQAVIKFAKDNTFSVDKIVAVEERMSAEVPYTLPNGNLITRTFTGQMDVVIFEPPDGAVILDWKTGFALPPESKDTDDFFTSEAEALARLSVNGYFQQRAYGYLVLKKFSNINRVTLREFYVNRGKARSATILRGDIEHIERELGVLMQSLDRALAAGPQHAGSGTPRDEWRPQPGPHCLYCPKPGKCPIEQEVRGEGAVTNPDQAMQYAAEYQAAQGVIKSRRAALKVWCSDSAPDGRVELKNGKGRSVLGFDDKGKFRVFTPDDTDKGPADPNLIDPKLAASMQAAEEQAVRDKALERQERRRR